MSLLSVWAAGVLIAHAAERGAMLTERHCDLSDSLCPTEKTFQPGHGGVLFGVSVDYNNEPG